MLLTMTKWYHGTSVRGYRLIKKYGFIKSPAYVTNDLSVAEYFAGKQPGCGYIGDKETGAILVLDIPDNWTKPDKYFSESKKKFPSEIIKHFTNKLFVVNRNIPYDKVMKTYSFNPEKNPSREETKMKTKNIVLIALAVGVAIYAKNHAFITGPPGGSDEDSIPWAPANLS